MVTNTARISTSLVRILWMRNSFARQWLISTIRSSNPLTLKCMYSAMAARFKLLFIPFNVQILITWVTYHNVLNATIKPKYSIMHNNNVFITWNWKKYVIDQILSRRTPCTQQSSILDFWKSCLLSKEKGTILPSSGYPEKNVPVNCNSHS